MHCQLLRLGLLLATSWPLLGCESQRAQHSPPHTKLTSSNSTPPASESPAGDIAPNTEAATSSTRVEDEASPATDNNASASTPLKQGEGDQVAAVANNSPQPSAVYKKEDDPEELAKAAESEKTKAENEVIREAIAAGQGDTPQRPLEISFNDLKFPIELASKFDEAQLTDRVKLLAGKHVKIKGYIMPTFQQNGIEQFVLLMNTNCKFGSAEDYAWCNIRVVMNEGQTASYTIRPITVEGVLKLDPMPGPRDYDISLFLMDGFKVTQ